MTVAQALEFFADGDPASNGMSDIANLLAVLNRLVDGGNTVVVIEHNMDVRNADWIVDLGPEGGSKGGRVVFEGTPRHILDAPGSLTGQYLARPMPAAR
jgi:excinuclease UvrABC ATPase subunit